MENTAYLIGRIIAVIAVIAMFVLWLKQDSDDFPPDSYP